MLKMLLNLVDCINYRLCVTHLDGPVNIARATKLSMAMPMNHVTASAIGSCQPCQTFENGNKYSFCWDSIWGVCVCPSPLLLG
jgi:hypothetical protein